MSGADELRFGARRTLNLRADLPTAEEAVRRAEGWIRSHQIAGSGELLVVTGRGKHSADGVPVVRPAIEKLLFSLRRRGVIEAIAEHGPGAFVVRLAPLRALVEAPPRHRDRRVAPAQVSLHGLSPEATTLLRDLAERSLDGLGIAHEEARVLDEMSRHLRVIIPSLSDGSEAELRAALRSLLAEYD